MWTRIHCSLVVLLAVGPGCVSNWNGQVRWRDVRYGPLLDQPLSDSVYLAPVQVDDASTLRAQNLAASLRDWQAGVCRDRRIFAECSTEPAPDAFRLSTRVRYEFSAVGKTSGQVSWGLADRDDKEIFAWAWKFEDFGGPSSAFTEAEGFPTFLRLATQAIVAKRAKANKPKAPSPSAARPDSNAKPSARHGRIIVAVFDVQDLSGRLERNVLEQLTEYLAAQLVEQGSYRVVPRGQIRNRLAEEKAESMSACFDEACQIELGKAVAAEKSLQTRVLRVGTICAVTSTLYDLRTETSERASTVEGDCSEDTLVASVKELAKRLVQQ